MTFLLRPRKRSAEVRSGRIVKWSPMERRRAILKTLTRKRIQGKKKWRGKQTLISASNMCSALGRLCKLELNQNTNSAFLEGEEGYLYLAHQCYPILCSPFLLPGLKVLFKK